MPGLHTRTSTIPRLLLENPDRHVDVTTSLALVMKETPHPLAVLSAMLYHVPQSLTLGQDMGGIDKRIANRDGSLSPPPELEGIK